MSSAWGLAIWEYKHFHADLIPRAIPLISLDPSGCRLQAAGRAMPNTCLSGRSLWSLITTAGPAQQLEHMAQRCEVLSFIFAQHLEGITKQRSNERKAAPGGSFLHRAQSPKTTPPGSRKMPSWVGDPVSTDSKWRNYCEKLLLCLLLPLFWVMSPSRTAAAGRTRRTHEARPGMPLKLVLDCLLFRQCHCPCCCYLIFSFFSFLFATHFLLIKAYLASLGCRLSAVGSLWSS